MPNLFVPKETQAGETRVAATPETVKAYIKAGLQVVVESDAGRASHLLDASYAEAGARLSSTPALEWGQADMILKVNGPSVQEAASMKAGAILVSFISPHKNLPLVKALLSQKVTTLAMELVPRITRAQKMDALSSQASIAGYKAVLIGASRLGKYFPLLMTAAGTVQPAKVVIMGAGVAGLQAIGTAKRLGAVVWVSDVRPAAKEQVESLGGKFIDLPMAESGEGQGGYAKEMSKEFLAKQQAIIAEHVASADVVITTAQIPGKPAPRLVSAATVERMRPGSVIVDLAAEQGGNCELTEAGKDVVKHDVLIIGSTNLPASMPLDASMLYSRNVSALVLHLLKHDDVGVSLHIDTTEEVTRGTLLTHAGETMHAPTAEALKIA